MTFGALGINRKKTVSALKEATLQGTVFWLPVGILLQRESVETGERGVKKI